MKIELAKEIVATYEKHGWNLRRVLITPAARAEEPQIVEAFPQATIVNSEIDALWFSRPSHGGREAWEVRLVEEQPYALFEAFECENEEEAREAARRELENKLRGYASG